MHAGLTTGIADMHGQGIVSFREGDDLVCGNGYRPGYADTANFDVFQKQFDNGAGFNVFDISGVFDHEPGITDTPALRNCQPTKR
jgi:hypothetical protein